MIKIFYNAPLQLWSERKLFAAWRVLLLEISALAKA